MCFAGISSSRSDLLLPSLPPAHQQRSHPRGEEGVCLPLAGLHAGAEALQGSVHAGGAHAKAHRREAAQVYGELAGPCGAARLGKRDKSLKVKNRQFSASIQEGNQKPHRGEAPSPGCV